MSPIQDIYIDTRDRRTHCKYHIEKVVHNGLPKLAKTQNQDRRVAQER